MYSFNFLIATKVISITLSELLEADTSIRIVPIAHHLNNIRSTTDPPSKGEKWARSSARTRRPRRGASKFD